MKLLNKIFSIAVAGIAVVGCNDLDTAPRWEAPSPPTSAREVL